MTIDIGMFKLIIIIITNVILITGAFWKLKIDINKKPDHEKVEKMIKRDSYSYTEGKVLETKIDDLKTHIESLTNKLDNYFKPKGEV